jgi:hypothetical protein
MEKNANSELPVWKRMLSSMKLWTVVLGLIGIFAAKYGFEVDRETYWTIVGVVVFLIGAQGVTDWGKSAAVVHHSGNLFNEISATTLTTVGPEPIRVWTSDDGDVWLSYTNGTQHDITEILTKAGLLSDGDVQVERVGFVEKPVEKQHRTGVNTIEGPLEEFLHAVYGNTGLQGIKSITVSAALAARLRLSPGNHITMATLAGDVVIRAEED